MELKRIELGRYKYFYENITVEIAPLTILVGANNSGKTALSRAPYLFSSSLTPPNGDSQEPLLLNSAGIRHGRIFEDLVTGRSAHGQLSLSAVLENGSSEVQLSVRIQNVVNPSNPSQSKQQINYWGLHDPSGQVEATRESLSEKAPYRIVVSGVDQGEKQISWLGCPRDSTLRSCRSQPKQS